MSPTSLGSRLRTERTRRAVSQSALARRTGIPQPAISRFENDRETPSVERIGRLLAGLGLRPELEFAPLAMFRGGPSHRPAIAAMTPGERLEQAAGWSELVGELQGKAR